MLSRASSGELLVSRGKKTIILSAVEMLQATPVDRTFSVFGIFCCSNQSSAAVMLRATVSEGLFSADCSQASSLTGGIYIIKSYVFLHLYPCCLHMLFLGSSGH